MLIPTLETEHLLLVPPSLDCDEAYQRFYTDAEASAHYGGPKSPSEAWARLAADIGSWHLLGFGVWAIRRRRAGDVVGTCGFWQGKGWPRELTWWLAPEARGQGIAKEASIGAIRHAYEGFGWTDVQTYMSDDNEAARGLVLSLGGSVVARKRFPDGQERDVFSLPRPPLPHLDRAAL
ncbi:MAG: GNAT family N-acetyltransferase [Acidobacteriota bacterium]